MHRLVRHLAVAAVLVLTASARAEDRGWFPSLLWIRCAGDPSSCAPVAVGQEIVLAIQQAQGNIDMVSGTEFGLAFTNVEPIELVPVNGFTNLGTMTSPILTPPTGEDCYATPFLRTIAELRVRLLDPTAFRVCFVASDQASVCCAMLCPNGEYIHHVPDGYRYGPIPDCPGVNGSGTCLEVVGVEPHTWGRIKSSYKS